MMLVKFFCTLLFLSLQKPDSAPGGQPRKRLSSEGTGGGGATPAKRKPSPIRFDAGPTTTDTGNSQQQQKRESQSMYTVPRDRYSKKLANGANFDTYQGGGRGRGRGRGFRGGGGGRGFRGGRGRRRGGSWRPQNY